MKWYPVQKMPLLFVQHILPKWKCSVYRFRMLLQNFNGYNYINNIDNKTNNIDIQYQ